MDSKGHKCTNFRKPKAVEQSAILLGRTAAFQAAACSAGQWRRTLEQPAYSAKLLRPGRPRSGAEDRAHVGRSA